MSPARRQRRGANPLLLILLVLVGAVGVYGTLYAMDEVEAPWLDDLLGKREVQAADTLPVLISARPLQPGSAVTRADIFDNSAGTWNMRPWPRSLVEDNQRSADPWILEPGQLLGRVLARPKEATVTFRESDFLPKGTRPGPQSLVPEGKQYLAVSESDVQGLGNLAFQDRFDLIAMRKASAAELAEARDALRRVGPESVSRELRLALDLGSLVFETPLASDGLVVRPAASGVEAKRGKGREVGLALAPEEISPVLAAIALGEPMHCLPRSNRAGEGDLARETGPSLKDQYEQLLRMKRPVRIIEGGRSREETMALGERPGTD